MRGLLAIGAALALATAAATTTRDVPAATAPPAKITICHVSAAGLIVRLTVSSRAITDPNSAEGRLLRAHLLHVGDSIVPGSAVCLASTLAPPRSTARPARITICHRTGSGTNAYRRITVSSRAATRLGTTQGAVLRAHLRHRGDLIMPGTASCTATTGNQTRLAAALSPVQGATGSGSATVTIRLAQNELCSTITVTNVQNVTAAHIHRKTTGAVVVPLAAPTSGTSSGCVTVERSLLREIAQDPGAFYVNVHTTAFPNGQVQGELTQIV